MLGELVTTDGRGDTALPAANGCDGGARGEDAMSLLMSLAA